MDQKLRQLLVQRSFCDLAVNKSLEDDKPLPLARAIVEVYVRLTPDILTTPKVIFISDYRKT